MADNVVLPGTGLPVATDEVSGVHFQRVKIDLGADGASAPVTGALPVSLQSTPLAPDAATQTTLAALKTVADNLLTTAQAIQAAADALNGKTVAVNTASIGGAVSVSNFPGTQPVSGPLTDAQLRAAALPVSSSALTDAQLRAVAVPVTGPLTDAQLRAAPLTQLSQAEPAPYWPSYGSPTESGNQTALIDSGGALITRSAVLTDEGTFRVNFANTSLSVSVGSVTISGATVSGAGFDTTDIHRGDYFKLDADAESAWAQVESINSASSLTLVAVYTGGTSGAASRTLVRPITANGGSIAVASGQCTLSSGTTSGAQAVIARLVDYAPLVWRGRLSISQRIVNQSIRMGGVEGASPARYFARFRCEGTSNTQVICETGRNPSAAPSAAETEQTTVTLPNGLTTAAFNDYRIEQLTESVRFYIASVLVAEHSRTLPAQYDIMTAGVLIENTAAAGSNTNVVVDFQTMKNHNKLEVGIMSDADRLVAAEAPADTLSYSVAGVIAINTVLLQIDCRQYRHLSWQCTAMGTTGVVTPECSTDGLAWLPVTSQTPAGASATTFNAAGLWAAPVFARHFRLRLSTATTAGTTTVALFAMQSQISMLGLATQPISGTVTANIGSGALAGGTNAIGDVGIQLRANATGAASGAHIVSAATTNASIVKASAGRLTGWSLANTSVAWRYIKLHNQATTPTAGAGVVRTIGIPPGGRAEAFSTPGVAFTTGIGLTITTGAADADATAVAASDVVGDLFFA